MDNGQQLLDLELGVQADFGLSYSFHRCCDCGDPCAYFSIAGAIVWQKVRSLVGRQESVLLSFRIYHGLETSHNITASAKSSCNALLKADAKWVSNAKASQATSTMDITIPELLRANYTQIILEEAVSFFCPWVPTAMTEAVKGLMLIMIMMTMIPDKYISLY